MGAKQKNLVGIKFNRLIVIEQVERKKYGKTYKRMWKCLCDCGNIVIQNTGALTSGNTKSCGCWHNELSKLNSLKSRHKLAKPDAGFRSIYCSYKNNAKMRNLEFNIDFEYFKKIITDNCFYCNIEPSNTYMKRYYNIKYNGIDRINNKEGYNQYNIVSCCKICNISKNNYTTDEYIKWVSRIVNHYSIMKLNLAERIKRDAK